jgi:cytochrome c|tara:strand:+ start:48 stop:968 length:921 start_codon:yes stop_codon:yes gene_type:complete
MSAIKTPMPINNSEKLVLLGTATQVGSALKVFALTALLGHLAGPALAESHASGNVEAGEKAFSKQCVSCHVVVNDDGATLAGRKAKTGPNLYGVTTRTLGTFPGFRYGGSIIKAGEEGTVWNEGNFVAFVKDPTGWLKVKLEDPKARSKMSFKVKKEEDAQNIFAFLQSLGPNITAVKDEEKKAEAKVTIVTPIRLVSYASDQANRGKKKYDKECTECHGKDFKGGLIGGPPLKGVKFTKTYADGAPASWLYEFMITNMPPGSPGRFSPKAYTDIMAYILKKNGFRPGAPLPNNIDALEQLSMKKK